MQDQTIQVNEHGIKVACMGSAAKYQPTSYCTLPALDLSSDVIIFATPEWLFTKQLNNTSNIGEG